MHASLAIHHSSVTDAFSYIIAMLLNMLFNKKRILNEKFYLLEGIIY